jgi:hypothetical protein
MELLKKNFSVGLVFAISLFAFLALVSLAEEDYFIRFRSGKILSAELMPGGSNLYLSIKNVNKYEPPSRITSDVAYAAVTVQLDPGRSLSIYDYSLRNDMEQVFPCIVIRENDGDFDASKWLYENSAQKDRFTMLFKVQMPAFNKPLNYVLVFNLIKEKNDGTPINFIKIENKPFTTPTKIPDCGIIGAEPSKVQELLGNVVKKPEPPVSQQPAAAPTAK